MSGLYRDPREGGRDDLTDMALIELIAVEQPAIAADLRRLLPAPERKDLVPSRTEPERSESEP